MFAEVIVEIGVKNVDKVFMYHISEELKNDIKIGIRVEVPFGNRQVQGFVVGIKDNCNIDNINNIKDIVRVIDKDVILDEEMLWLGKKIKEHTLCSLISAYQVMLPKALKASIKTDIKIKYDRYLYLNKSKKEVEEYILTIRSLKQKELLERLLIEKKILITSLDYTINTLIKKDIVKIEFVENYRYKSNSFDNKKKINLNTEQLKVIAEVEKYLDVAKTFLLYGVTGSGKTEVYMNLISKVIARGKSAIVLVPEISLTTQIVSRFTSRFGDSIAVIHSGLSDYERYDEYRKIKDGLVNIVIGARSAIFAPFNNLGIIIIDEEQTLSYKQDSHPRYHARDIAIWRSNYHKCPVLLGSATPSLESFARSGNGVYNLLTLTKRAGDSRLPHIIVVDMKKEARIGNFIISQTLEKKMKEQLTQKKQVILLLNRRGYSSMFTCSECGNTFKCPNCDISLTYHKTSNNLTCHYCNYSMKKLEICPNCGSHEIKDYGIGTEKLEEYIKKILPLAKVVRMDMDTTTRKGSHEKIIKDFSLGAYDILVGTQMIAKGLDFPNVTLVGVINADSSLNIPDFRSSERTFELLSQVSGRAGRGSSSGEVVIQTFNDTHYSINYAKNHDYLGFYKEEMKIRKKLKYSPYYFIVLVNITSSSYELGFKEADKIGKYLRSSLSSSSIVLGPSMANVFKVNNIYRYQCIIKYQKDPYLRKTLEFIDNKYKDNNKVNVDIDIDPNRL